MIHIAILLKPFLDLILDGTKTVECRMTVQARPPFEVIEPGERMYLKQSAGPYRGVAVAEHVLCEGNLTPKRLKEIKRDYNDLICADEAHWRMKRNSRFITLIWLRDVQPCDHGPAIPPSQGAAWIALENETAWRRTTPDGKATTNDSFFVEVTPGNLRNNTLYITKVIERFPKWALGGPNQKETAEPITLMLYDGPTVQTDIVAPRKLLRTRCWGKWFRDNGVSAGDKVVFTPVDEATYFVGLARA